MPEGPLYRIIRVKQRYSDRVILDIPELIIENSASVGFIGPNGCGKSALLRILAFLEKPAEGRVYYGSAQEDAKGTGLKREVTFLLQEPYLLKRSVFENVAYGLKARGEKRDMKDRVREALRWVGLSPAEFERRRWFELSAGEARRVALASRIVLRPRVLILDEPTAGVDRTSASLIREAIASIRKSQGTTLVVASHDTIWLNSVTGRILRLSEGRIAGSGTDNVLPGPWILEWDGLWKKSLPDGQKISAVNPPDTLATAVLSPSDILISMERPLRISAQNILRGAIASMSAEGEQGKVRVEVTVCGFPFLCAVTPPAAENLQLLPGKEVFLVFKASSLEWHSR